MANRFLIYFFISTMLFMAACADTPCSSVFTSQFQISYFKIVYNETDSETVEQPFVLFNRVYALSREDSLFVSQVSAKSIIVSVDPDADQTTFIVERLDTLTIEDSILVNMDTLTVSYSRRQRLISEDCSPEQLYVDFKVAETTYDSTKLLNDQLRTTNKGTIEVYL